jgi:hypothetical protein
LAGLRGAQVEVKGHPVATDVPRSGEPRRVVAFCLGLLAAALGTGAVLLAAVVGFRDDAVFLGPLVVALLVGPLDAFHWGQRAVAQRLAAHSRCLGAARKAAEVACR